MRVSHESHRHCRAMCHLHRMHLHLCRMHILRCLPKPMHKSGMRHGRLPTLHRWGMLLFQVLVPAAPSLRRGHATSGG